MENMPSDGVAMMHDDLWRQTLRKPEHGGAWVGLPCLAIACRYGIVQSTVITRPVRDVRASEATRQETEDTFES
jgi:hypothetical protein